MKHKTLKVLTISSALLLSSVPTATLAEVTASSKTIQISESSTSTSVEGQTESSVDKVQLVKRVRELFPNQFEFLNDEDFRMDFYSPSPFEQSEIEIHRLSFHKRMDNDNYIHGSFEFTGETLELTQFYNQPNDLKDALYPPKVSKQEAEEIAKKFIEKYAKDANFEMNEDMNSFNSFTNTPLTEPIEYRFQFNKIVNDIPVSGQTASVTVLGNGEITQYYNQGVFIKASYQNKENIITKEEALQKLKDNYSIQLRYLIRPNYEDDTKDVFLAFAPSEPIRGIDAKSGNLNVNGELVKELKSEEAIKMLPVSNKKPTPITKEQAKELAKELLDPKNEDIKLVIEGVMEPKNPEGEQYYEVRYMYYHGSGGSGSSIRINKSTGELMQYHGFDDYNRFDKEAKEPKITYDQALEKAVEYIKKYAYSHMDEFAYPIEQVQQSYRPDNAYYFNFPRIKDGLLVEHDSINVSVSKEDGALVSINSNYSSIKNWPKIDDSVDKETALGAIKQNLDLELMYSNPENGLTNDTKDKNYSLLYNIKLKNGNQFYNALSGDWQSYSISPYTQVDDSDKNTSKIKHPWAEEELNFMIQANILTIKDPDNFNPDVAITKGTALEMLSKSLTRVYSYPDPYMEEQSPFENIPTDHELYDVIKRSAELNIINTNQKTFNVDENISREELAYWFIRALKLNEVAKQGEIFKYNITDTEQINKDYKGYVALAIAFNLLTPNEQDQFAPQQEVTYAQMAVASMRLAKKASEMKINN